MDKINKSYRYFSRHATCICMYVHIPMHPYIRMRIKSYTHKNIHMRKTRIYTDYVYRSQTEHLHFGPSHDLINDLNSSSDMSALYDVGKIFQIFAP